MLYIQSFTFNPFQENTYIIYNDDKECWIVDPGMYDSAEVSFFTKYIDDNDLTPVSIINTHTHLDHIFGVAALKEKYNIPFGIHQKDLPVLDGAAGSAVLFGFDFKDAPTPDFYIEDSKPYALGNDEVQVILAPGHSPGSIVFYYPIGKWAISGDVLFNGSIGRTDLLGGNYEQLINSIKTQMYILPDEVVVHSGHGPSTTIGNEKASNPFVTG